MESNADDSAFMEILHSFNGPNARLGKISGELRKISQNLGAGKEINPKKIKTLAGSLDYWVDKSWKAGLSVIFNPVKVMRAYCEIVKASSSQKKEHPPKPMSPEGKLLLEKYGKAVVCLSGIVEKVKTGELTPEVFDSFIEKAEELAATAPEGGAA